MLSQKKSNFSKRARKAANQRIKSFVFPSCQKFIHDGKIVADETYFYVCRRYKNCSSCSYLNKLPSYDLSIFETTDRGFCVRTNQEIKKDSIIGEYVGTYYLQDESDKLDDKTYFFQCSDNAFVVDSLNYGNITRYFTHRCYEFNMVAVEISGWYNNQKCTRIFFKAVEDIKKGSELSFCYFKEFKRGIKYPFKCACHHPFCVLY